MNWISVKEQLPTNGARVLGFIPGNEVYLPGKSGETELREVVVLYFQENFYFGDPEKATKHGLHFWKGEGSSNQFFTAVTHWMPLPTAP